MKGIVRKLMNTEHTIDAPEISGYYFVSLGGDKQWYVTRFTDCYRNGGQNATDTEIEQSFATQDLAKEWVKEDLRQIAESNNENEDNC